MSHIETNMQKFVCKQQQLIVRFCGENGRDKTAHCYGDLFIHFGVNADGRQK